MFAILRYNKERRIRAGVLTALQDGVRRRRHRARRVSHLTNYYSPEADG